MDKLATYRMEHLDEHFRAVVKKICPNLYNFKLHYDSGRIVNIDFYFEDDPRRDEPGYTGCGLNEFVAGSSTSEALITIARLMEYAFNLKWDE